MNLTPEASDDALLAAVRAQPGIVQAVGAEAARADQAIRHGRIGRADLGLAGFWADARWQIARLQVPNGPNTAEGERAAVAQLRVALDARALLAGVVAEIPRLSDSDVGALVGSAGEVGFQGARRVAMERYPGLAACLARVDAQAAAVDAAQREASKRQAADEAVRAGAARQARARALVGRLAAGGVTLTTSTAGVLARPAALLDAAAAAEVKELRAELLDMLTAPAELVA